MIRVDEPGPEPGAQETIGPAPAPEHQGPAESSQLRPLLTQMFDVVVRQRSERTKEIARRIWHEPWAKRTWSEFFFTVLGAPMAGLGLAFVAFTMGAGALLTITFVGLFLIALGVHGARVIGGIHRNLARSLLDEEIEDPEPFVPRHGMFGWLQSTLRDRTGWRSLAYILVKVPLAALGITLGFAAWWDAFFCVTFPIWGGSGNHVAVFGLPELLFGPGFFSGGQAGFWHGLGVFFTGILFFFAAPWAVRVVVHLDRLVMRVLLAPDVLTARVRSLEQARTQTVDSSAATLRRIERDLHDGTQAQLVALAMRLGMAKEKLAGGDERDLQQVRQLVDDAHRGAKEAIIELRDLARGIHPPALDVGLEGALSTLTARSTVPTALSLSLTNRPTPAIEAIAYFCVAELLANVAQHSQASRATVTCTDNAGWLRVVVRDDGRGGAELSRLGSSSSGLTGLTDRVHAVDGRLDIMSPPRGPTVVTVDLPLHA
jgi:signal transduction histidine kinase